MTTSHIPPADAPALTAEYLHELRTPLNHIIGYSEMLCEQAQEEGQQGFMPDLQKIHAAGHRLLDLLNRGVPLLSAGVPGAANSETAAAPEMPFAQPQVAPTAHKTPDDAAQALILVVDDNKMNRDMLSRRLERQGHDVMTADSGRSAMDLARGQAFDLVLLDIMMPEMDGYAVLQQLKAEAELRHIPVIMISALDELDSVVRCIEMGAEDYLLKPFNPILLKARIGACLEKKRAHDREKSLFGQCQQNYSRLQELEKVRDDLTHMIVHDLRTPLTSVLMGIQTMEVIGDLNEVQQELVDIALRGGATLLGMINDLLDISKMESGSIQRDDALLSASELVANAVSQIARLAKSSNLTLVQQFAAHLPPFRGDANKLVRTLVNLLGNAIKFTPGGGTVTVAVRQIEDEHCLLFAVSDTGEGIAPEEYGRVFEKFAQVESRRRGRTLSTGLGLTFCKLAVEAHGGRIQVVSKPDQGSTFSFTIPLMGLPGKY